MGAKYLDNNTHFNHFLECIICSFLTIPLSSFFMQSIQYVQGFPGGNSGKEFTCQCRRWKFNPWVTKIPWRREWQPTPVFLPGESHGQRILVGYSAQGRKKSDTTNIRSDLAHTVCLTYAVLGTEILLKSTRPTSPFRTPLPSGQKLQNTDFKQSQILSFAHIWLYSVSSQKDY